MNAGPSSSSSSTRKNEDQEPPMIVSVKLNKTSKVDINIGKFKLCPENLINKSIALYGRSGSGKTVMLLHIMHILKRSFPRVIAFVPLATQKFYKDIIPDQLMFDTIEPDHIARIWKTQEEASASVIAANNINTLHSLFTRIADKNMFAGEEHIKRQYYTAMAEADKKSPAERSELKDKIDTRFTEKLTEHYKRNITAPSSRKKLETSQLSEEEKFSLKYMEYCPNVMLIFDDMGLELKGLTAQKGVDHVKNLFFKGRHLGITTLVTAQSDKFLGSEFRKNIHTSIFTSQAEFATFFGRSSMGGNGEDAKVARAISKDERFFNKEGEHAHRKLIYIGDSEENYFHVRADKHPKFKMCSIAVRNYCKSIAKKEDSMKQNKIFK